MYKYRYIFANYVFEIESCYDYFVKYAKSYITEREADFSFSISLEDITHWKDTHKEDSPLYYVETLVIQTKVANILTSLGIYLVHGSCLYLDNIDNGYLFTGPSGVGKSTHVSRLKEYYQDRLTIINDDKPFIDKSYYLYGSPWSGKSHININNKAKLKGIFILYQSKDNKIERLEPSMAIDYLIKQIYLPKEESITKIVDYLISLVKDMPIYHLGLNLEDDAINNTRKIMEQYED